MLDALIEMLPVAPLPTIYPSPAEPEPTRMVPKPVGATDKVPATDTVPAKLEVAVLWTVRKPVVVAPPEMVRPPVCVPSPIVELPVARMLEVKNEVEKRVGAVKTVEDARENCEATDVEVAKKEDPVGVEVATTFPVASTARTALARFASVS